MEWSTHQVSKTWKEGQHIEISSDCSVIHANVHESHYRLN